MQATIPVTNMLNKNQQNFLVVNLHLSSPAVRFHEVVQGLTKSAVVFLHLQY